MTGIKCTDFTSAGRAAKELREKKARNIIVTLGKRGSVILEENKEDVRYFPAYNVNTVDETVVGDAFSAGFFPHYLLFHNVKEAVEFGTLCGAFAVTKLGSYDAMQTIKELTVTSLKLDQSSWPHNADQCENFILRRHIPLFLELDSAPSRIQGRTRAQPNMHITHNALPIPRSSNKSGKQIAPFSRKKSHMTISISKYRIGMTSKWMS